ncbi:DoxX family protein [Thorsellia anophelis]|uniref:Putative oxidoreductase n=1 Tax=Thorsellia anophelis DSM 18579 TaxID=1123402 RepID=A0A1I0DS57_9GAMM|nr:DoxX family protein [Thorsellia anophelis]SET35431.1 putative oxidoreductase [Thorsellia anophelis DSM 18579]
MSIFGNKRFTSLQANTILLIIAKLLIIWLFLPAGINKITGFEGTVGYISSVGLPFATLGAILAILIEVFGSLLLLVGYQQRLISLVLAIFTLLSNLFFHAYWNAPADSAYVQQLLFNKNIAVVGGLLALFVAASMPHSLSIDSKLRK